MEHSIQKTQPHASGQEREADAANDAISDVEMHWKQRINEKLLEILDLSLIETIGEERARQEIRDPHPRERDQPGPIR